MGRQIPGPDPSSLLLSLFHVWLSHLCSSQGAGSSLRYPSSSLGPLFSRDNVTTGTFH